MKVNKIVEKMQTEIDTLKRQVAELYALCEKEVSGSGELITSRRRDEIVEQAKRDLENLKERVNGCYMLNLNKGPFLIACNAEFIVNKEKRTVVALLRPFRTSRVIARGVAKCVPNDCFNVHIGKAIALYRALGLPVPTEYLDAPQPTGAQEGDIVTWGAAFTYKIEKGMRVIGIPDRRDYTAFADPSLAKVIDDSREEVAE